MPRILLRGLLHAPLFTNAHASAASAIRWRQLTLRTRGGSRSGLIEAHQGFIRTLIETNPDLTLDEIRDALAARGAMKSVGAGQFQLTKLKISFKNNILVNVEEIKREKICIRSGDRLRITYQQHRKRPAEVLGRWRIF